MSSGFRAFLRSRALIAADLLVPILDRLAEERGRETADAIERVLALHFRDSEELPDPWCAECNRHWPCDTRAALDGAIKTGGSATTQPPTSPTV